MGANEQCVVFEHVSEPAHPSARPFFAGGLRRALPRLSARRALLNYALRRALVHRAAERQVHGPLGITLLGGLHERYALWCNYVRMPKINMCLGLRLEGVCLNYLRFLFEHTHDNLKPFSEYC